MSRVGLCGSDLAMVYRGMLGDLVIQTPVGIGHEASGVVAKCGSAVTHLKPGESGTFLVLRD